ncbi:MAG TPA: DUF4157 domain-containing protein [Rhizomicrobium sp.]|nr:DUF4157 domain-containing protein [Rhizomicrobium sp.]
MPHLPPAAGAGLRGAGLRESGLAALGDAVSEAIRRVPPTGAAGSFGPAHESHANAVADLAMRGQMAGGAARPGRQTAPHDAFADVRLHTGPAAEESAGATGARAYAAGSHIVLGRGLGDSLDASGRWIVAHELAHVAQQRGREPAIQRVGPLEAIARFFGGGTFSDQELQQYLQYLQTHQAIEDHYDSDNKAREVVRRWKAGQSGYAVLIIPIRILLIKEMASGYLSGGDQQGILDLVTESIPAERAHIFQAVDMIALKARFDGERQKRLGALLDQHDIDSLSLGDAWSVPETKRIITRQGDGALLTRVLGLGFKIFKFATAFDKWRYPDGSEREQELLGLQGNTDKSASPKRIRLRQTLNNEVAATTLYHESNHAVSPEPTTQQGYLDDEIHARVEEEGFRYRHGEAPDEPDFRTKAGTANEPAIRTAVTGSPHYNPQNRRRVGRRYVGEQETTGWDTP